MLRETRLCSDMHFGERVRNSNKVGDADHELHVQQESSLNQTGATNRVCLASSGVQGWLVRPAHQVARVAQAVQAGQAGWGSPHSQRCCW